MWFNKGERFLFVIVFMFFSLLFVVIGTNIFVEDQESIDAINEECAAWAELEEAERDLRMFNANNHSTISGFVKDVQFSQSKRNAWMHVVFEDGREKTLDSLSKSSISSPIPMVGKDVTITFNGNNTIISIEVK